MENININQQEQNINTTNSDQKEETKNSISKNWLIYGWKDSNDTYDFKFDFQQDNFHFSTKHDNEGQFEVTIELEYPSQFSKFFICIFIQNKDIKKSIKESNTFNFMPNSSIFNIILPINQDQLTDENGFISPEGNLSLIIDITKIQNTSNQPLVIPILNSNSSHSQIQTPVVRIPPPYSGLKNQGSTCYMNSILQSLYHIPLFKLIIYSFDCSPKNDNTDDKNIPLNLQRLFGLMQLTQGPCSTYELTKSFGWDAQEIFMQNDAQEFCRQFLDNLEMKMQGTELEQAIPSLFRGKVQIGIRCRNVPYQNMKMENFYDISLDVKDSSTLEESFQKVIEDDPLIGENQYDAGPEYGKQDADVKTEYLEFPKVLHLHLRRFMYEPSIGKFKLNKKFSYPEIIDLAPYMQHSQNDGNFQQGEEEDHMNYELFGVLVHWGTIIGGHYYAYIRTTKERRWYEFNDAKVVEVSPEIAIEGNFGGPEENNNQNQQQQPPPERLYSAYMLIYVRQDSIDEVFSEVSNDKVPEHVVRYIQQKEEEEKKFAQQQFEKENTISTPIVMDKVVEISAQNNEIKINVPYNFEQPSYALSFNIKKYDTFKTVYKKCAELEDKKIGKFILFPISRGKIQKALPISDDFYISSLSPQPNGFLFWPRVNNNRKTDGYLAEEEEEEEAETENDVDEVFDEDESNLLFVLAYFRSIKRSPLHYVFAKEVRKGDTLNGLFTEFRNHFHLHPTVPLSAYRAVNAYQVEPFAIEDLQILVKTDNGPFLVVQPSNEFSGIECCLRYRDLSFSNYDEEEEEEEYVSYVNAFMKENPETVIQYMSYHYQTVQISIQAQSGHKVLIVPYKINFHEVKSFIADAFQLDYNECFDSMLIFPQSQHRFITSPDDNDHLFTVAELIRALGQTAQSTQQLFFIVIVVKDTSIDCLFDTALIEIVNTLVPGSYEPVQQLFPNSLTVADAIFCFRRLWQEKFACCDQMRIVAIENRRAYWLENDQLIVNIGAPLKLEFVPSSQLVLQPSDLLISVLQFKVTGYLYNTDKGPLNHIDDGDPYLFKIVQNEKFAETKARLLEERRIPAEIQRNLQFFLLNPNAEEKEHVLVDDDIVIEIAKKSSLIYFGPTNAPTTNYRVQRESSIKIYN